MTITGAEHPTLVGRVGCAAANVNVTNVTAENAALRANGAPNTVTASELAQRLHARRSGNCWIARCPAHDDHTPSLSIHENERGIGLKCFAGCDVKSICEALNIQVRDLFSDKSTLAVALPAPTPRSPELRRASKTPRAARTHANASNAVTQSISNVVYSGSRLSEEKYSPNSHLNTHPYTDTYSAAHLGARPVG